MNEFTTAQLRPGPFQIVAPVAALVLECECGCGALTELAMRGSQWVAANENGLYFGVPRGFRAWCFGQMLKIWRPRGLVRIVLLQSFPARLFPAKPTRAIRMGRPPMRGVIVIRDAEAQEAIDRAAGCALYQPPPGASPVDYVGPLVRSDPPMVPRLELFLVVPGAWTIGVIAARPNDPAV